MLDLITDHWFISIVVTLVLGVIANALWEYVFKPIFQKLGKLLFFILSLGFRRATDNIYREAAKGTSNNSSNFSAYILVLLCLSFLVMVTTVPFVIINASNTEPPIEICKDSETKIDKAKCIRKNRQDNALEELTSGLPYFVMGNVIIGIMLLYSFLKVSTINGIEKCYLQSLKIGSNYISDVQIKNVEHDFALIKTKSDFDKVMEVLLEIASQNDVILPAYGP